MNYKQKRILATISIVLTLFMSIIGIFSLQYAKAAEDSKTIEWNEHTRFSYKNEDAFCIEYGVSASGIFKNTEEALEYWDSLGSAKQIKIRKITTYADTKGYLNSTNENYFAVQRAIYKITNPVKSIQGLDQKYKNATQTVYDDIINNYIKINYNEPLFDNENFILRHENNYSLTCSDKNKVLSNWSVETSNSVISATICNNELTISADGYFEGVEQVTLTYNKPYYLFEDNSIGEWGEQHVLALYNAHTQPLSKTFEVRCSGIPVVGKNVTATTTLNYKKDSKCSVRTPETLILDGETGKSEYLIGVSGDLSPRDYVTATFQDNVLLSQNGKENVEGSIEQNQVEVSYDMGLRGSYYDYNAIDGNFYTHTYSDAGIFGNTTYINTYSYADVLDTVQENISNSIPGAKLKFLKQKHNETGAPYIDIDEADIDIKTAVGNTSKQQKTDYSYAVSAYGPNYVAKQKNENNETKTITINSEIFEKRVSYRWGQNRINLYTYDNGNGYPAKGIYTISLTDTFQLCYDSYYTDKLSLGAYELDISFQRATSIPVIKSSTKELAFANYTRLITSKSYDRMDIMIGSSLFEGKISDNQLYIVANKKDCPVYFRGEGISQNIETFSNAWYNMLVAATDVYIDFGDYILQINLENGYQNIYLKGYINSELSAGKWEGISSPVTLIQNYDETSSSLKENITYQDCEGEDADLSNIKYYVDIPAEVNVRNGKSGLMKIGIKLDENQEVPDDIIFNVQVTDQLTNYLGTNFYLTDKNGEKILVTAECDSWYMNKNTGLNSQEFSYITINFTTDDEFTAGTYSVDIETTIQMSHYANLMSHDMFTWDGTTVTGLTETGIEFLKSNGGILTIPSYTTAIGDSAFSATKNGSSDLLTSVSIFYNVETIGNNAFDGNNTLTKVDFNKNSDKDYIKINADIGDYTNQKINKLFSNSPYIQKIIFNDISITRDEFYDYTEIEYIESTGTQWIDTRFKPTNQTQFEADFQFTTSVSQQRLAGVNEKNVFVYDPMYQNGNGGLSFCNIATTGSWTVFTSNTSAKLVRHYIKFNVGGKITVDDTSKAVSVSTNNTTKYSMYIFAWNEDGSANNFSKTKIYSCKIREGENLVREYIPVLDFSGTPCLYDFVTKAYYYNQGTDSFVAGPTISTSNSTSETGNINNTLFNTEKAISINNSSKLKSIGNYAFRDCTALIGIELPNSLVSIGTYAFYNNTDLMFVLFGNSLTTLGNYSFSYCSSLKSVELPDSVTTLGTYVFDHDTSLKNIVFNEGLTNLNNNDCSNCTALTTVTIPNTLLSTGSSVFQNCTSINSISLPEGFTALGDYTFDGNTLLSSLVLPSTLQTIGDYAFRKCTSLTEINLPDNVTKIGANTFINTGTITAYLNRYVNQADVMEETYGYTYSVNNSNIDEIYTYDSTIQNDIVYGYNRTDNISWITSCSEEKEYYYIPSSATIGDYGNQNVTVIKENTFVKSFGLIPSGNKNNFVIKENNNIYYYDDSNTNNSFVVYDINENIVGIVTSNSIINPDEELTKIINDNVNNINFVRYIDGITEYENGEYSYICTTKTKDESKDYFATFLLNNNISEVNVKNGIIFRDEDSSIYFRNGVRYVSVSMNGNSKNSNSHVNEIQVLDVNGNNLAVGLIPYGSSTNTKITDNDTATSLDLGTGSKTIYLDLQEIRCNINCVKMWRYYTDSRYYKNTVVKISADNENWITIWDSSVDGNYDEISEGKEFPIGKELINYGRSVLEINDSISNETRSISDILLTGYTKTNKIFYNDAEIWLDENKNATKVIVKGEFADFDNRSITITGDNLPVTSIDVSDKFENIKNTDIRTLFDLNNNLTSIVFADQIIERDSYLISVPTEIEYIESTGTQWIDTRFKPTNQTQFEADFQFTTSVSQQRLAGVNEKNVFVYDPMYQNGSGGLSFCNIATTGSWTVFTSNTSAKLVRHYIKFNVDGKITVDDTSKALSVSTNNTTKYSMYIFAWNEDGSANNFSKTKIYSCKIREGENLVRDYVPALDSNGTPCLYDFVTDKYYYNQGTGTFKST